MPTPTVAEILDALAATGRDAAPDTAQGIAREIAVYGGPERAAQALAHDDAHALLSDLLAYGAALAELADPALRIARLRREAADLDTHTEPLWAEAAQDAGSAAHRLRQGEIDLAAVFQRRSEAADRVAADLEAQAFAKRLQAAVLEASATRRAALHAALAAIAA